MQLLQTVGDEQALMSLTTEPRPDEPVDLPRVPEDVRERVARFAARVDAGCDELFGIEHRTAGRPLLSDVAEGDRTIFLRRSRENTTAATIAWLAGRANDSAGTHQRGPTARALLAWFGVSGSVWHRHLPSRRHALRTSRYLKVAPRFGTTTIGSVAGA